MTVIQLETHCRMLTVRRAVANMEKEKRKMSRQCLHELSANSSPNSDTTDVYRSDKSI